jgi:hypothetical protein
MLVIRDEQIIQQLQALAERQQRPVEDILKTMLESYKVEAAANAPDVSARVAQLKQKLYARARKYWQEKEDIQRSELSDDVLNSLFWGFDVEGIPYLKSDVDPENPPRNPLLNMALKSLDREMTFQGTGVARRSREILNEEFADYILNRSKRRDGKN